MDNIFDYGSILILYILFPVLIYAAYGRFAVTVNKWMLDPIVKKKKTSTGTKTIRTQPDVQTKDKVKCYIPGWQPLEVQKALFGEYGLYLYVVEISLLCIVLNILFGMLITFNSTVMLVCHILFIIGFIALMIVYRIITARCAYIFGFSKFDCVICALFPLIGDVIIGGKIPRKMQEEQQQATFEEVKDDTIIKQRHNKREDKQTVSSH